MEMGLGLSLSIFDMNTHEPPSQIVRTRVMKLYQKYKKAKVHEYIY